VKVAEVRRFALSLPEVTEEPHFRASSFRILGRIFVNVPPGSDYIHVFVGESGREPALAMYPGFLEKLQWGGKVVGLRVSLEAASPAVVRELVEQAWIEKAPRSLAAARLRFGARQ
jgi:hypothetical protein